MAASGLIDSEAANDPDTAANSAGRAVFAAVLTAKRFIGYAGHNSQLRETGSCKRCGRRSGPVRMECSTSAFRLECRTRISRSYWWFSRSPAISQRTPLVSAAGRRDTLKTPSVRSPMRHLSVPLKASFRHPWSSTEMIYLLDSNVCIAYLRGRSPYIRTRLAGTPLEDICLCSVVKAELVYGTLRSANPTANRNRVDAFTQPYSSLPFDDAAAELYASIRRHLESLGTTIGPYDLQIAAIALANACTLVTHNTGEFKRVPSLLLEDWELP
jgi:tRNA(fMet)-specific endonuclease VapC